MGSRDNFSGVDSHGQKGHAVSWHEYDASYLLNE